MSARCETCGGSLDRYGGCSLCLIQLGISQGAAKSDVEDLAAVPSLAELNQHFPQLQITRLVGRGGMGAIFHARQTALDRDVALKIIAKEVAGDTAFIERFEREAKTLARLSHPNIVTIFDFGHTADGQAYLIMEFVDGINLREAINSNSVDHADALVLVSTICQALKFAHSKGVVHRDIKPENILLDEDGSIKVADFGIAKIVDKSVATPTLTATQQVLGSLHYLAPEHLESPSQIDHRVDIYALGVIFYELLTGQLPLGRYEPPSTVRSDIDPRLDAIVMKSLSRQPSQRYQSAGEFEHDLNQIMAEPAFAAPSPRADRPAVAQVASVRFTCDAFAGLAQSVGMVRANADELTIEHRLQDAVFGTAKTNVNQISVPRSSLLSLDLVPGVRNYKLVLMTDTISALDGLVGAESGRAELKIKRHDKDLAVAVVQALGFSPGVSNRHPWVPGPSGDDSIKSHAGWATFGVFMLFCGIVNAGLLAIANVFFAEELRHFPMIAAMVGTGILIGPIALIQSLTGLLCLIAKPVGLARAAAIVSMIPTTPGWILSFPVGVWSYRWLRQTAPRGKAAETASPVQETGASQSVFLNTAALFIPESRWGRRLLAVGNAVLATVCIGAFVTFQFGLYPTTMTYRLVDSAVEQEVVLATVAERIHAIGQPSSAGASRLNIAVTARNTDQVRQLLAIEGNVQLAWLAAAGDQRNHEGPVPDHRYEVAGGLDLPPEIDCRDENFGRSTAACAVPAVMESKHVSTVSARWNTITLILTQQGQQELLKQPTQASSIGGLGLVIDGVIEGVATKPRISGRRLTFQLSERAEVTAEAIGAAIRGPKLPTELELLP